jgi:hypothetical protein
LPIISYLFLFFIDVAFTKLVIMYQICNTWIHPLPSSPVSTDIIFLFKYMCKHFCTIPTLLHYFPTASTLLQLVPIYSRLPPPWTCTAILFSNFVKEKRKNKRTKYLTFLLIWNKGSYKRSFFVMFPFPCIYVL